MAATPRRAETMPNAWDKQFRPNNFIRRGFVQPTTHPVTSPKNPKEMRKVQ